MDFGRQRTDSTQVLGAIRDLNRVALVGETLRHALNELSLRAPDWVRSVVTVEWYQRYGRRFDSMHQPESRRERDDLIQQIGDDGRHLLERARAKDAPASVRSAGSIEILRRVWLQQYFTKNTWGQSSLRPREGKDMPPSEKRIQSPYDVQAHFARHNDTDWIGYKVHLTETCDEDAPIHLITNVKTEVATKQDVDIGVSDVLIMPPERLTLPPILEFAEIAPTAVQCYPLTQQVAEKVHTYSQVYASGESTRVKDLVDILLMAGLSDRMRSADLRKALEVTFARRATRLPQALRQPPSSWSRQFRLMAEEVELDITSLDDAIRRAKAFLDPILQTELGGVWQVSEWRWSGISRSPSS